MAPTQPPIQWELEFFPVCKAARASNSAEVKNKWSYTTPPVCLHKKYGVGGIL
jgi:hypothetical protein